mmetsp:Transcript_56692/g.166440  ORF Transcript_56692/g.166440 Transcript_56692/m.166440 type:complete len:303 (+) Transcript_56692:199-1107(+)
MALVASTLSFRARAGLRRSTSGRHSAARCRTTCGRKASICAAGSPGRVRSQGITCGGLSRLLQRPRTSYGPPDSASRTCRPSRPDAPVTSTRALPPGSGGAPLRTPAPSSQSASFAGCNSSRTFAGCGPAGKSSAVHGLGKAAGPPEPPLALPGVESWCSRPWPWQAPAPCLAASTDAVLMGTSDPPRLLRLAREACMVPRLAPRSRALVAGDARATRAAPPADGARCAAVASTRKTSGRGLGITMRLLKGGESCATGRRPSAAPIPRALAGGSTPATLAPRLPARLAPRLAPVPRGVAGLL